MKLEKKEKNHFDEVEEEEEEEKEEKKEIEYSAIILDDWADALKSVEIQKFLNKIIIKSRHLCVSFFITLQSYTYMPKQLRKQVTYLTLFKTKNKCEFEIIAEEILNLKKEDSLILYEYVFDKQYNHLDIDTCSDKLYKNFDLLNIKY
jgi:hypothetical protein